MWLAVILKWVSVSALILVGGTVLLAGLGANVPLVKFLGVEAYGLPSGAFLVVCAIWLARSWKISSERVVTKSTKVTQPVSDSEQSQVITIEQSQTDASRFKAMTPPDDRERGV